MLYVIGGVLSHPAIHWWQRGRHLLISAGNQRVTCGVQGLQADPPIQPETPETDV